MFICFEGIDGAGKSTQTRMLYETLSADGISAEIVADPGTTQIGRSIRQILLDSEAPISSAAQMLLFSAGRAELAEYIRRRLAEGVTILCDRWLLSTLVYQGEINNISIDLILKIFQETCGNLQPDICFLLDLPPETARERMGKPSDRYEKRCLSDRQRMRAAYMRFAGLYPNAGVIYPIDASRAPEATSALIHSLVRGSNSLFTEEQNATADGNLLRH